MDGCTTGEPLSVTFSNIYMVKMKNDVVVPYKPIFYRRFVDDICSWRKLGNSDLFDGLKYYHPNIKLTIEVSPSKFLDISLTKINGASKFNIYWKNKKLFETWTSKSSKRYKQNTTNGDLYCSKKEPSNFHKGVPLRKEKVVKADYSLCFIKSIVNDFKRTQRM